MQFDARSGHALISMRFRANRRNEAATFYVLRPERTWTKHGPRWSLMYRASKSQFLFSLLLVFSLSFTDLHVYNQIIQLNYAYSIFNVRPNPCKYRNGKTLSHSQQIFVVYCLLRILYCHPPGELFYAIIRMTLARCSVHTQYIALVWCAQKL